MPEFDSRKAEDVLHLFDSYSKNKGRKGGYFVSCPFHGSDSDPSLHIYDSDATGTHKLMVKCFGCDVPKEDILRFINSDGSSELDIATLEAIASGKKKSKEVKKERGTWKEAYNYKGEDGSLRFQIIRFENPKDFVFRRPSTQDEFEDTGKEWVWSKEGVEICLYNSNLISAMRAKNSSTYIWKLEGESKCNLLGGLKLPTTCNPFGGSSGKFLPQFAEQLRGLNVVLIPDNDLTGYNHIYEVAGLLLPLVNSLKIIVLPRLTKLHDDVKDWFNNYGGTKEELLDLLESAEELKNLTVEEIKQKFPYNFVEKEQVHLDLSALDDLLASTNSEVDSPQLYSEKLQNLLQRGRETLEELGSLAGVCDKCLNTGFVLGINDDNQPAVMAKQTFNQNDGEDGDSVMLVFCNHGQFEQSVEDFDF